MDMNGDIWLYGAARRIDEDTPHQFLYRDIGAFMTENCTRRILPVTDGHGTRVWVQGRACTISVKELGNVEEEAIEKWHSFVN